MARKIGLVFCVLLLIVGCAKENPTGPTGPQGDQGPQGPEGPGYSEVNVGASKDNYINSLTGNVGSSTILFFGYSTATSIPSRALLNFDVSGALANTNTAVSAILTLYPTAGTTAGNILSCTIYPISKNWDESNSTWLAATGTTNWDSAGGDYISTQSIGQFSLDPGTTNKVEVSLDETYIKNWINGSVPNYGFIIRSDNEGNPDSNASCHSKDSTETSKQPNLKIVFK